MFILGICWIRYARKWGVGYPNDSTDDHIMKLKGSAYYKTLRSHYITENGAASTFDETELSSNAFEHIRNQGRTAALWL